MIRLATRNFSLFLLLLAFFQIGGAALTLARNRLNETNSQKSSAPDDDKEKNTVAETIRIVAEIIEKSYPELRGAHISVKVFHSRSDYFRARFSVSRFLTFRKLHFIIFVNPQVFEKNATPEGVRAIIAHELAHAAYYRRHNRFELFGLASLLSKSFVTRFERGADLEAVRRGYGAGLKEFRQWLYRNIPARALAEKRRNYFSPEEIDLILAATKDKPELLDFWRKNIPRSLAEINVAVAEK